MHAELAAIAGRARERRSGPADLTEAAFTITNLGGLGIESFTPIITPPQAAVLGVWVIAGRDVAGRPAWVSLTFDRRVADGADAARSLVTLAGHIGEPRL